MALESEAGREVAFAEDRAGATITGALEGRTGFATQVVALRELTETTDKSIRDLRGRYNELILQNDAATASRVAELELKKLEFLQQQEQNFFSNMISVAGIAEQQLGRQQANKQFWANFDAEEDRFTRGQTFELDRMEKQIFAQERQQMLGLAAQYGVEVGDGDSIESIIKKVSPFVNETRRLEMEEMRASIANSRAQAARALQGEAGSDLGDVEIEALARAYANGNEDVVGFVEDGRTMSKILERAGSIERQRNEDLHTLARSAKNKEEFTKLVSRSGEVTATQAEIDSLAVMYAAQWENSGKRRGIYDQGMTNAEKIRTSQLRNETISAP